MHLGSWIEECYTTDSDSSHAIDLILGHPNDLHPFLQLVFREYGPSPEAMGLSINFVTINYNQFANSLASL